MPVALILLGALLVSAALGSGAAKLAKVPAVMTSMTAVGVKPQQVPILAALEMLGAIGVVLGIWSKPLGIAASAGLALYFLGAVASHARKRHGLQELAPALMILIIAIALTFLEISR